MRIEPLTCLRPDPKHVAEFASLPYDIFSEEEARAYVERHPKSFLAIDRPETGFDEGVDQTSDEVYAYAQQLLRERQLDGTLVRDEKPCYYLYEQTEGSHRQRGLVAAVAVDDYLDGTIRKHELTLPAKELDRVRHITTTRAQTGPVFLAYQDSPAIDAILAMMCTGEPLYDFVSEDGVRQRMWRIAREVGVEALAVAFTTVEKAYIADGHHRAAASARICEERRAQGKEDDPANYFLAVLFPASQLEILPYDRLIAPGTGPRGDELTEALTAAGYSVGPQQTEAVRPVAKGEFGIYCDGSWRRIKRAGELNAQDELDVETLQRDVLGPIFGIDDPRNDGRLSFMGGVSAEELARACKEGGVGIALCATTMAELMVVSDAGGIMPPKSTWFSPKLLSGLIIRRIW